MASPKTDELLAAIRRLPLDERLRLLQRASSEAEQDTPNSSEAAAAGSSLLGLMADDPDLVDRVCAIAYEARSVARMRSVDD